MTEMALTRQCARGIIGAAPNGLIEGYNNLGGFLQVWIEENEVANMAKALALVEAEILCAERPA
jgi:hypothetical protein